MTLTSQDKFLNNKTGNITDDVINQVNDNTAEIEALKDQIEGEGDFDNRITDLEVKTQQITFSQNVDVDPRNPTFGISETRLNGERILTTGDLLPTESRLNDIESKTDQFDNINDGIEFLGDVFSVPETIIAGDISTNKMDVNIINPSNDLEIGGNGLTYKLPQDNTQFANDDILIYDATTDKLTPSQRLKDIEQKTSGLTFDLGGINTLNRVLAVTDENNTEYFSTGTGGVTENFTTSLRGIGGETMIQYLDRALDPALGSITKTLELGTSNIDEVKLSDKVEVSDTGVKVGTTGVTYNLPPDNTTASDGNILKYNSSNGNLEFSNIDNIFNQSLNINDDVVFNSVQTTAGLSATSLNIDGDADIQNGNLTVSGTTTLAQTLTADQGITTNNLTISTGVNSYSLPSNNINADDGDVLKYNATSGNLEFSNIDDINSDVSSRTQNITAEPLITNVAGKLDLLGETPYEPTVNNQFVAFSKDFRNVTFTNEVADPWGFATYDSPALNNRISFNFNLLSELNTKAGSGLEIGIGNPTNNAFGARVFIKYKNVNDSGRRITLFDDTNDLPSTSLDIDDNFNFLSVEWDGTTVTLFDENDNILLTETRTLAVLTNQFRIVSTGNSEGLIKISNLKIEQLDPLLKLVTMNPNNITVKNQIANDVKPDMLVTRQAMLSILDDIELTRKFKIDGAQSQELFRDDQFVFTWDATALQLKYEPLILSISNNFPWVNSSIFIRKQNGLQTANQDIRTTTNGLGTSYFFGQPDPTTPNNAFRPLTDGGASTFGTYLEATLSWELGTISLNANSYYFRIIFGDASNPTIIMKRY